MRKSWLLAGGAALILGTAARAEDDFGIPALSAPPRPRDAETSKTPVQPVKRTTTKRAACPSGPPTAILKYMEESLQVVADDRDPREVDKAFRTAFADILLAADKVLAHPDAKAEDQKEARQFQASVLYQGALRKIANYADQLERLAQDLYRADPKSEIAALAAFLNVKAHHEDDSGLRYGAMRDIQDYISKFPRDEAAVDLLTDVAQTAEAAQRADYAQAAYDLAKKHFPKNSVVLAREGIEARLKLLKDQAAPDIRGTTADGRAVDLSRNYTGKVTLINFWSPTSQPCMPDLDTLKDLQRKYGKQLQIVGIPVDADLATVQKNVQTNEITWTQLVDENAETDGHPLAKQYGVTVLPTTFVVNARGETVATSVRGTTALEKEVAKLLGESRVAERDDSGVPSLFKK